MRNHSLYELLPAERVLDRLIDRVSYAADAGFYYLLPRAVVQPMNEQEIQGLFQYSQQHRIPLVFRAGGTSLSGQSITDGILVDLSKYWNRVQIEQEGQLVRVQPGLIGAQANQQLKKWNRKIGPDPSSLSAARMGGILSNNASGMCCGVKDNSYHTLAQVRFILPNGKLYSTEAPNDRQRFEHECPELYQGLLSIRKRILATPDLFKKITEKYQVKNTVGYSLNAFVDHADPLDIFAHLLIGGEGTLAFISEAVLKTVPEYPCKSTSLLLFPDISAACEAIEPLTQSGVRMIELMDRASLRVMEASKSISALSFTLPEQAAALLVEFQENEAACLHQNVNVFLQKVAELSLLRAPVFTEEAKEQEVLWKLRKGLFPSVGAVRARGTTVILEDLCFPVERLGAAIQDLQQLFQKYQYEQAILFGHAKDGNIHFVITQSFQEENEVARYDRFIRDVVSLVVEKYQGSLKAEHGTGRNMAPFVEAEWGGEAYAIMRSIKQWVDPQGLLNPGVIIANDPALHIKDLKALPEIEEEVDRCTECGFCEYRCPSHDLTMSPKRRIVTQRMLRQFQREGKTSLVQQLQREFQYEALDTCAVDGLCSLDCPVGINTGDLVKRLRQEQHAGFARWVANASARHFQIIEFLIRGLVKGGVWLNQIFGIRFMPKLTQMMRKVVPGFPLWLETLAAPPAKQSFQPISVLGSSSSIVYYPTCVNRMMGGYLHQSKDAVQVLQSICQKTNIHLRIVQQPEGTCCGQVFSSKGFREAHQEIAGVLIRRLWEASEQGKIPIITDVSSCTYTLHQLRVHLKPDDRYKYDQLVLLDLVDFLHDQILPLARVTKLKRRVMIHPVCSLQKMQKVDKLLRVARSFATEVEVPEPLGCCGMAGDRGFFYPELTRSALSDESRQVQAQPCEGYYSTTRTCELALSEATQQPYTSILYLIDEGI